MKQGAEDVLQQLRNFPILCPHCQSELSIEEVRSILGQFGRSQRVKSIVSSRYSKMTQEERSAESRRVANIRWASVRSRQDEEAVR